MPELSVHQAAVALGVSHVQIGRLIDAGELGAHRFGRSWAIDSDSLRRYRLLRPRRGRPLSERASWDRLLGAESPADIDAAIDLARLVRRRSRNRRVRILPAFDRRIDDDPRVHLGGAHAAIHHGAGIGLPQQRDIYVCAHDADAFCSDFLADPDAEAPNVVIRVVDGPIVFTEKYASALVAVLDLIDAADTRAAAEALQVLR